MGKPTLISLFAGIGGLDLAAHWAGFETVRFVEKKPFCQKVLAKHWPNVPIDDDVFTSHPGHADVVCGGFPCQPFSVAGNRQGRNDERFLLPEMLRIVDEVKPYAVLFENVPGFPSLNDGAEFKYLLRALAEMGFDAEWGHIRASDIGAPHQRERWFLLSYASDLRQHTRRDKQSLQGIGAYGEASMAYGQSNNGQYDSPNILRQIQVGSMDFRGRTDKLGNPTSAGLEGRNGDQSTLSQHSRPSNGRQAQSRIRGNAYGLPGRLDFVGFPARPGEPQHAYEPSRTAPSTPTTNARIKALGNAVVPQCAYPIFAALADWFAENETSRAA